MLKRRSFLTGTDEKFSSKSAVIGIYGLGYVGIPLALQFSESGFSVLGFDVNKERIETLNAGTSPIKHIPGSSIAGMRERGFEATTDMARTTEVDVIIICVPTPLNEYREPDLSFVTGTLDAIAPHLRKGQMLSLESTTWPGTTEEVIRPYIEARGLTPGQDFYLVYSPEREDPGNERFTVRTIPKVVGGSTPACSAVGAAVYGSILDRVVTVSSTQAAEMVKLLENIHRSVNIGLVNEIKIVADRMGLNVFEIIDAAATKPFGFTAFYPGPGIGGHCIPIDPFYLTWKAREYGLHTRFIELAGEINAGMPQYVVNKLVTALNQHGKPLKGSRILALGIAYKRDVDDMRESPSVEVMEIIREWGGDIQYHDPYIPVFPEMRQHNFALSSIPLTPETLSSFDAVILLTDHRSLDYDMILENASLIIDTRGKYPPEHEKVERA
jgi:UDP-N-acetyl-D-glucosamine dehydrogenase